MDKTEHGLLRAGAALSLAVVLALGAGAAVAQEAKDDAAPVAGAGAGAAPAGATSAALPPHAVKFDAAAGTCRIFLEPAEASGASPPRLFLMSRMLEPLFGFGLDGGAGADAVMIRAGQRVPFVGRDGLTAAKLLADPVWSLIDSADATDSLYFTVRDTAGSYSSARYDALRKADILRLATLACRAEGLEAPPRSDVEHRDAEMMLDLADAQVVQIRQVLAATYGEPGTDVGVRADFTVTDRRLIAAFNAEKGYASGQYLWPASVAELLAQAVTVADAPGGTATAVTAATGEVVTARHGDWVVLRSGATCRIATPVMGSEGFSVPPAARMEFAVEPTGSGGQMAIDLIKPNPFAATAPIGAIIAEQGFVLTVEPTSGAVIPQPLADGRMSNDLLRSLRGGKDIILQGAEATSGAPVRVAFSAMGFSAAFKAMAEACNRPGVMGWIE